MEINLDRAAGVLLGSAAGDALGVPYEFKPATESDPKPKGGGLGNLAPGQWSDDTDMACAITRVALTHKDLRSDDALDAITAGFHEWFASGPGDVGIQTTQVLSSSESTAASTKSAAKRVHDASGRSAGNGSLMRTGPVALAYLDDEASLIEAARTISGLTHYESDAGDACVLWCLAIRHAVLTGKLDLKRGLPHVDASWAERIDAAESNEPSAFAHNNSWVVAALQGAWSAVIGSTSLEGGLRKAVCGGGDTDTVAAIAGSLLGAAYGASAVPQQWRRTLHGWPGWTGRDLVRHAVTIVRGDDRDGWPSTARITHPRADTTVTPHPDDAGVLMGTLGGLVPDVADAVVSLCRLGTDELLGKDHYEIWLVDRDNANRDAVGVLRDTAELIRDLRAEGKTVFVHCVHAQTRTPLAGAAYAALLTGDAPRACLDRVVAALPNAHPRASLVREFLEGWTA